MVDDEMLDPNPGPGRDVGRDRATRNLFAPLPKRYDRLARLLSMGQDGRWRRTMVDHIVPGEPARVLDVACGPAGVTLQLARRSGAEVIGIDLSRPMLEKGRSNVVTSGLGPRIGLVLGRGQQLPFRDGEFDAVMFTYLLRYVDDPQSTLDELARVLRPGGTMASLEFSTPPNAFWRFWWWGYTRLVLPLAGWLTGGPAWFRVGRFLGPSISDHYRRFPIEWTTAAWRRAGMVDVGVRTMSLGGGLVMWGNRSDG